MVQAIKGMQKGDTSQIVNSLMQSNPDFAKAVNTVVQNGYDGKSVFYEAARSKGMNDEQITEFLTQVKTLVS